MDPLIGSALISGGSSLLGGLFGKSSAKKAAAAANAFTREQMQNRHQWEVSDLRKAGLNPILSAGGTPSMGSSAMEQQVNPNVLGDAVSSALQAKLLKAQIANTQQDTVKKGAETASVSEDAKLKGFMGDIKDDLKGFYNSAKQAIPAAYEKTRAQYKSYAQTPIYAAKSLAKKATSGISFKFHGKD